MKSSRSTNSTEIGSLAALLERVVEAIAEQGAVGEVGEGVVEGLELQLPLPLAELGDRPLEVAG